MLCPSHIRAMSVCLLLAMVTLVKVLSARVLPCEVTAFPFVTNVWVGGGGDTWRLYKGPASHSPVTYFGVLPFWWRFPATIITTVS